jgi:hypothetical protein
VRTTCRRHCSGLGRQNARPLQDIQFLMAVFHVGLQLLGSLKVGPMHGTASVPLGRRNVNLQPTSASLEPSCK